MKIQINTAHDVPGSIGSNAVIEKNLMSAFERFADRITRLEVHFHDDNAGKGGASDKNCMIEARLAGMNPFAVEDSSDNLASAIQGATHKMIRKIESALGRQQHHQI